jgi:xanthine dehydrogenase small subunit
MTTTTTAPFRFYLNGDAIPSTEPSDRLLLDFLRRDRRQVGTKEGCREGDCGACGVLIGAPDENGCWTYRAVTSCMVLLGHLNGCHVVTIEGLRVKQGLNSLQQAVVDHGGSQCGFCTPGFMVSFTAYVMNAEEFSVAGATQAISGNLCRCTGYASLVRAAQAMVQQCAGLAKPGPERIAALIQSGVLPELFAKPLASIPAPADIQHSGESVIMGGGTDLIVQQETALRGQPLEFQREAPAPRVEGDTLLIPGTSSFEDLKRCPDFLALWPGADAALERFASPLIRERASVAGNIANASPIADGTAIFLALDAQLELLGPTGPRSLPLHKFFLGYKQIDLKSGERIHGLRIPLRRAGHHVNFEKLSKREYLDIATITTAIGLRLDAGHMQEVSLSAGGVGPVPMLLRNTADHLNGKPLSSQSLLDAVSIMNDEITPISDVRGSAEYKRLALRQLFFAHFLALFPNEINEVDLLEVSA